MKELLLIICLILNKLKCSVDINLIILFIKYWTENLMDLYEK